MAENSRDFESSSLLCTEMNDLWCDDVEKVEQVTRGRSPSSCFDDGRLETSITFPCLSDEQLISMINSEKEFLPKDDYFSRFRKGILDLSTREEALNWILKAYIQLGFGGLVFFLSVNYFDRFLSLYDMPQDKAWAVQLLAVACLSIASKMEELKVPLTVDLQVGNPRFVFEGKTIRRMELLVLSTLKWKMRAYTPNSFIDYFIAKISDDQVLIGSLISTAMKLILRTTKGIDFLEFKPSEIGAAVSILAGLEKQALDDIHQTLASFIQIEKDKVLKCIGLIQEMVKKKKTRNIKGSPDRVLEAACLSYKSEETTVESCLNSRNICLCRDDKRRKLQDTSHDL